MSEAESIALAKLNDVASGVNISPLSEIDAATVLLLVRRYQAGIRDLDHYIRTGPREILQGIINSLLRSSAT